MKALIVGTDYNNHEIYIGKRFLVSHESGTWEWYNGQLNQSVVNYARVNNFDCIVYSYSELHDHFTLAENNPDIMIFMPSYHYNSGSIQQLVITEHYPTKESGAVFEFSDCSSAADSYSNGYIAGQICEIAKQLDCSLSEARIRAGLTVSDSTHKYIVVEDAVAYSGEVLLGIGEITTERTNGFNVTITLERIIDATSYQIEVRKVGFSGYNEIVETETLTNNYRLENYGTWQFRYKGINEDLESDWSEYFYLYFNKIDNLIIQG